MWAAHGRLTWCVKCGSYAERWAVGLAAPCKGQPTNQSQTRVWRRLWNRRHPRTNGQITSELVLEVAGVRPEGVGLQLAERRVEQELIWAGKHFHGAARDA